MKKRNSKAVLALLVCSMLLSSAVVAAQEAPPMVRVVTVHTHLGHGADFEAGLAELAALGSGMDQPGPFVGMLTSSPGSYDLVFPMASWSDVAAQEKRGDELFAKMGSGAGKMFAAARSIDTAVYQWRGDLAYLPENPRVPEAEVGFTRIVSLRPHIAHAAEFEGVIKKASALRKKHGLHDAVDVWELVLGADGPEFVVLIGAKNESDFYTHQAQAMSKMGSDWQQLMNESSNLLREIEYSSSVPRPDLMAAQDDSE